MHTMKPGCASVRPWPVPMRPRLRSTAVAYTASSKPATRTKGTGDVGPRRPACRRTGLQHGLLGGG
jgi:hypothetical protein